MMDKETIALKLIELANFMAPTLMFVPLDVENVESTYTHIEDTAIPFCDTLDNLTVSATVSNGGQSSKIVISFLVNSEEVVGVTV